jgi:hypothetical protein
MAEEKTNVYNRAELSKTTAFKKPVGTSNNGPEPSYYIEYKEDSAYHRHGETQLIKADEAFIGREAKCLIRFDTEHFPTVSREHAVIQREGDAYKIVHKSQTNATLVNGSIISQSFYLQDGDEIQLSEGGPRISFLLKDKPQASDGTGGGKLRSYKLVTIILAAIVAAGALGFGLWKYFSGAARNVEKLSADVYTVQMTEFTLTSDAINDGQPFTYKFANFGDTAVPSATGFMTSDNHLVTSHHVVEPWLYKDCTASSILEDPIAYANLVLTKFGGNITATFKANSNDGKIVEFTSNECVVKPADTKELSLPASAGQFRGMPVRLAVSPNDYVYVQRKMNSNIVADPSLWSTLSSGSDLHIVGILPENAKDVNGNPVAVNAKPGLVKVTLTDMDKVGEDCISLSQPVPLRPGSPVFCKKRGKYYFIGTLVSMPDEPGVIMPFSELN